MVDEKGAALVVYHGTTGDFDVFDTSGLGSHFSASAEVANKFGAEGSVLPVYLRITNPLRIRDPGGSSANATMLSEALVKAGAIPEDYVNDEFYRRLLKRNTEDAVADYETANVVELESIKALLESKGIDGIVYKNTAEGGGDSYIAFRPEQIKSATGNRGTFDPENPSVLFSRRAGPENTGRWAREGMSEILQSANTERVRGWFAPKLEALLGQRFPRTDPRSRRGR